MERRAKIVATIGPASRDEQTIRKLIQAGMNVARINFSHGTYDDHIQSFETLRRAADHLNRPLTILQDLQGPKIRTGRIENNQAVLVVGERLELTTRDIIGNNDIVPVDFNELPLHVKPGGKILLDDGHLELSVTDVRGDTIETVITLGGILKPNKGVNLPGVNLNIKALTDKDIEDLKFGLEHDIDAIALSFVRSAKDVSLLRQEIVNAAPQKANIPIIAKLERPEAMNNLHEIIHVADGVMVARGDLGVEMSPEMVPIAQKQIINIANKHLKTVITATQMLESMMENPRPTRAEASDVANAIFDGSDAVMLSGETAIGKYPVKSVEMMDAVVRMAETHMKEWGHAIVLPSDDLPTDDAIFISRAACSIASDKDVAAIAVFTSSGRTGRIIAKGRPDVPILGFTPKQKTYQQLGLIWGISPFLIPEAATVEEMLSHVEAAILSSSLVKPGQEVVLIAGFPVGTHRPANFALLHTIGIR